MERAYFSSTGQIFLNYKVLNNQALIYKYMYIYPPALIFSRRARYRSDQSQLVCKCKHTWLKTDTKNFQGKASDEETYDCDTPEGAWYSSGVNGSR